MSTKKTTYEESFNKRAVRKDAFSRYNVKNIIGLAGPDLYGCVKEYEKSGFNNISVYENDRKMMLLQLPQLNKVSVDYHFEDIYNAPLQPNTVYDLDFCSRLAAVEKYVRKFTNNFVITVSERGLRKFASIGLFLHLRDERFKSILNINENVRVVETDKGKYLFASYHDKSPMLIIHKL